MGVGSALDLKFLVRVRGATGDPLDDVVLQVKQVRDLGGIPCIRTDPGADPCGCCGATCGSPPGLARSTINV